MFASTKTFKKKIIEKYCSKQRQLFGICLHKRNIEDQKKFTTDKIKTYFF